MHHSLKTLLTFGITTLLSGCVSSSLPPLSSLGPVEPEIIEANATSKIDYYPYTAPIDLSIPEFDLKPREIRGRMVHHTLGPITLEFSYYDPVSDVSRLKTAFEKKRQELARWQAALNEKERELRALSIPSDPTNKENIMRRFLIARKMRLDREEDLQNAYDELLAREGEQKYIIYGDHFPIIVASSEPN